MRPRAQPFTLVLALLAVSCMPGRHPAIVIGRASPTPQILATVAPTDPGPPETTAPQLAPRPALAKPSGSGPAAAAPFRGAVNVPSDLLFFLVVGSDARPGQDVTRSRADSLHVVAVDPQTRRGTVLGLPRDSYVNVPGHGKRKINAALALGGPDLMVRTVRELTGFPITFYAVTGFEGIVAMTDELGGVDVYVSERMDDPYSEARFEQGWHHMDGRQVLAYTRNRHVQGGDLTRSKHQGEVILAALTKLRAETSDREGIRHWLRVLYSRAQVNMGFDDAVELGTLARSLIPSDLVNVVAPGHGETRDGQSVIVLDEAAYALFRDVGADAVADGSSTRRTPAPTAGPTQAPTAPPPSSPPPTPTAPPTPTPTPLLPI